MSTLKESPNRDPMLEAYIQPNDVVSSVINRATGERKTEIELACIEYLQDSDKNRFADFLNFISNMIELVGGKNEKREQVSTFSNPLVDQENQTSIVFKVATLNFVNKATGARPQAIEIKVESTDKEERLSVLSFSPPIKNHDPLYRISVDFLEIPPKFNSYITGKPEAVNNEGWHGETILLPSTAEVKGFAQKVFAVYQRQGQQDQTPALQS